MKFTISWTNGHAGVYNGTIDRDGFVSGTTYDRYDAANRSGFHLGDALDCA